MTTLYHRVLTEPKEAVYLQDDIARGLCATLTAFLLSALAYQEQNPAFLKGALALARTQAALYGLCWRDVVESLYHEPELCGLVQKLQEETRSS
jgi:hypothetical protein